VRDHATTEGAQVIVICARIEEEISELEPEERLEFLQDLGIEESGLDQLVRAAYSTLGLATYFTAGEKEVRAWTFKQG
ncbi:redox-regulated ATPase YchF, partial [Bacillus sp. SIMBA_161]